MSRYSMDAVQVDDSVLVVYEWLKVVDSVDVDEDGALVATT